MIPRTPEQIRAWLERMGISHALAAEALGLGNADKVMREYCSTNHPREPANTTRMHMDLMESAFLALKLLQTGQVHKAKVVLEKAMATRNLIDPEIDTTPERKSHV